LPSFKLASADALNTIGAQTTYMLGKTVYQSRVFGSSFLWISGVKWNFPGKCKLKKPKAFRLSAFLQVLWGFVQKSPLENFYTENPYLLLILIVTVPRRTQQFIGPKG
jgi:hypothetical protein